MIVARSESSSCIDANVRHIPLSHFGISLLSPGSEKTLHLVVWRTRARNVGPLLVLALRISSGYNLASLSHSLSRSLSSHVPLVSVCSRLSRSLSSPLQLLTRSFVIRRTLREHVRELHSITHLARCSKIPFGDSLSCRLLQSGPPPSWRHGRYCCTIILSPLMIAAEVSRSKHRAFQRREIIERRILNECPRSGENSDCGSVRTCPINHGW